MANSPQLTLACVLQAAGLRAKSRRVTSCSWKPPLIQSNHVTRAGQPLASWRSLLQPSDTGIHTGPCLAGPARVRPLLPKPQHGTSARPCHIDFCGAAVLDDCVVAIWRVLSLSWGGAANSPWASPLKRCVLIGLEIIQPRPISYKLLRTARLLLYRNPRQEGHPLPEEDRKGIEKLF